MNISNRCSIILGLLLAVSLGSCSYNKSDFLPLQHWHGIEILVEPAPMPVRPGATEFIVRTTEADGHAAFDLIISVRLDQNAPWRQAIQDGQTGVYRRGLVVEAGQEILYMQIRKKDETADFKFPLNPDK